MSEIPQKRPNSSTPQRSRFTRKKERGSYDMERVFALLDEALVSQLGFLRSGSVCVLPLLHARLRDHLYLHGAAQGQMMRQLCQNEVCVSTTIVDGLVFGRSQLHHSLNYRSVCIFGRPEEVTELDEKQQALAALVNRSAPDRALEARAPTAAELRATGVVRIALSESTFKQRSGPPMDGASDLSLPYWAGVVPLGVRHGEPVAAHGVNVPVSAGVRRLLARESPI